MGAVPVPLRRRQGATVVAEALLDPKRTGSRGGYNQDKVSLRVAVAKKKFSKVNRPRSVEVLTSTALLTRTQKTRKVSTPGVMTIKVPLSTKVSSSCATAASMGDAPPSRRR